MTLRSHVVINGVTQIGENSTIHPFVSLGATPQDLKYRGEPSALVVGRDCAVHEFSSVSGGTAGGGGATTVGDGVLLMSHTHVGHDCTLGDRVMAAVAKLYKKKVYLATRKHLSEAIGHFDEARPMSAARLDASKKLPSKVEGDIIYTDFAPTLARRDYDAARRAGALDSKIE